MENQNLTLISRYTWFAVRKLIDIELSKEWSPTGSSMQGTQFRPPYTSKLFWQTNNQWKFIYVKIDLCGLIWYPRLKYVRDSSRNPVGRLTTNRNRASEKSASHRSFRVASLNLTVYWWFTTSLTVRLYLMASKWRRYPTQSVKWESIGSQPLFGIFSCEQACYLATIKQQWKTFFGIQHYSIATSDQ